MDCNSDTADDGAKKEGMPQRNLGVDSKVSRGLRALICRHKIWISWDKPILSDPRCVRLGSSLRPMQFIGCTVRPLKTARTALFPCLGAVQSHQLDWCLRANDSEIITDIQPTKIIYLFPPFSRVAPNGSCMFLSSFYQAQPICQIIVKCVIMAYHGIKSSLRRFLIVSFFKGSFVE